MSIKAQVATVCLGDIEFEGLLLPDGSFAIAIPQVADLFLASRNVASRDLKRLLGGRFETSKAKTEFNQNTVNIISLSLFQLVAFKLAVNGNKKAQDFCELSFGLSIQQLYCDAFKIKFEQEERQQWIKLRQSTKDTFRPMTEQLQRYGFKESWEYGKFIHLFQQKLGIVDGTRDKQGNDKLNELMIAQATITAYMKTGIEPYKALSMI